MIVRNRLGALWVLGALLSTVSCTERNTNDFRPTENVLRRGSEGSDDEDVRELRRRGLPSTIEEAEAAPTGLLVRVENAISWPKGAKEQPTACHLNAQLCGLKKEEVEEDGATRTRYVSTNCHPLLGTVNQDETEVFYLTSDQASRLVKDTNNGYKLRMEYKITCQTTSTWYPGGDSELHEDLGQGKQNLTVKVVEARPLSYRAEIESTYTPR